MSFWQETSSADLLHYERTVDEAFTRLRDRYARLLAAAKAMLVPASESSKNLDELEIELAEAIREVEKS